MGQIVHLTGTIVRIARAAAAPTIHLLLINSGINTDMMPTILIVLRQLSLKLPREYAATPARPRAPEAPTRPVPHVCRVNTCSRPVPARQCCFRLA